MPLCFIAIVPSPEIITEVKAFQNYAMQHFNSGRALRAPPHITLESPFKIEADRMSDLEQGLHEFAKTRTCFQIQLENFAAFPPRVIFVGVTLNRRLDQLKKELSACLRSKFRLNSSYPDRPFRPHMTVAFRDLRKQVFPEAWDYFSQLTYQRNVGVSKISLLQHNGSLWKERRYFEFSQQV